MLLRVVRRAETRAILGAGLGALLARRHRPLGAATGAAIGMATTRVWPVAPPVTEMRRRATKRRVDPIVGGSGVAVVVNSGAGSAEESTTTDLVRERLPEATVVEVTDGDDVLVLLERTVKDASVAFAAAGGDGTLSAAASLALDNGLSFLALPAGTLNHFARDLGLESMDDAIDAAEAGDLIEVDVAEVGDRTFVNTCTFGAYTELVDAREKLEDRIGKWPAVAIALVSVLRRAEPLELRIDGRTRRLWIGFIGNCRYHPTGFAPSWRRSLDDGQLDIRLVDADEPLARLRLLGSVLLGRLAKSTVYEQRVAPELTIESDDPTLALALDGETCEVPGTVTVRKRSARLGVFAPHR